jgi:hypothetical protein
VKIEGEKIEIGEFVMDIKNPKIEYDEREIKSIEDFSILAKRKLI